MSKNCTSGDTGEQTLCDANCHHLPLHMAVFNRDHALAESLLLTDHQGSSVQAVNAEVHCQTPLHFAVLMDDVKMAGILLDHGASLDIPAGQDNSYPIGRASCAGKTAMTSLFTERGANVNIRDARGRSPLWLAAQHGHTDVIRHLLNLSVDVDSPNNLGVTPLIIAELNGFPETVEVLVSAGADVNQADFAGNTPLLHSVRSNQSRIANILLDAGADPDKPNQLGERPVHVAARHGNVAILDHLIAANCDLNAPSTAPSVTPAHSERPIMTAIRRRHLRALRRLVGGGANLDLQDEGTALPLVEAILSSVNVRNSPLQTNNDVITTLIQGGCDVNRQTLTFEMKPIEYALLNSRRSAALLLLQADIDPPRKLDIDLSKDDPELYNTVMKHCSSPLSMKRLCRKHIRRYLGFGLFFEVKVSSLGLPKPLIQFMLYTDLSLHDTEIFPLLDR